MTRTTTTRSFVPHGRLLWALTPDAVLSEEASDATVSGLWGSVTLHSPPEVTLEALRRMTLGPVALENVDDLRQDFLGWSTESEAGCRTWSSVKEALNALGGYVVPSLALHDGLSPVMSMPATSLDRSFQVPYADPRTSVQLADGATITDDGTIFTLSAPDRASKALLYRWPAKDVVQAIAEAPGNATQIAATSRINSGLVHDVISLLLAAELLRVKE
ncbi:MAG TPA: hypothetical protein VIT20_00715 [Propionibacteriaceae bacterium]